MIQNVELFSILHIPAQLTELKNYKYMQYVGTSPSVAILSSLIHYSLIKKFDLFTKLIQEFVFLKLNSKLIQKHLQNSYKVLNPVKEFFEYFLQDKKKEIALEDFTLEFFEGMGWLDRTIVNLSKIACRLKVTIQFTPENKKFGTEDTQQKILIFSDKEKFFNFIIPPIEFIETQLNCSACKKPSRQFCQLKCSHMNFCLKCIERIQNSNIIRCERCSQNTFKSYISIQLENIEYKKKIQDLVTRYYVDNAQMAPRIDKAPNPVDQDQSIHQKQEQQRSNQVEAEYKQYCEKCYQYEDLISHFQFPKCEHIFCYSCLKKCVPYPSLNQVQCLKCFKSCSKVEIDNYNQFYESAYQEPQAPPQCSLCQKPSKYDLLKDKYCKHAFCFDCLNSKVEITKYQYCFTPCLIKSCKNQLDFNQCLNYIKKINSAQIEDADNELKQKAQQSQVIEQCLFCQNKFPYKLFEVNYCKHKFCAKCLHQKSLNQKESFCLHSHCTKKYQLTDLQDYIMKLQQYSKQGQTSETSQQLKPDDSKKLLNQEQKPDQLAQTLEKVKSVSQKVEYQADQTINLNSQQKIEPDKTIKVNKDIKRQDESKTDSKSQDHSDESTKNSLPSNDNSIPKKDSKEDFNLDSLKTTQVENQNTQKIENQFKNLAIIKWVDEDSIDDIVVEQIAQFDKQEQEETKGQCSNCCQDFSIYNRKQVECALHKIGVCCITMNFDKCPQCEKVYKKPVQTKLKIERIKPGLDFMFEETLPHPSRIYQPSQFDKTLTRYNDYRALTRGTTDLVGSQRFSSVDTRLTQQQRVEPRKENYYESPMIQSHQPLVISRQPQYNRHQQNYDIYRRQVY